MGRASTAMPLMGDSKGVGRVSAATAVITLLGDSSIAIADASAVRVAARPLCTRRSSGEVAKLGCFCRG